MINKYGYANLIIALLLGLGLNSASIASLSLTKVFETPVSRENTNLFATNIAYYQGSVFIAAVEDREDFPKSWRATVIHQGRQNAKGIWYWSATVIDKQTLPDRYHTVPSIGIDEEGYIHIAYNMHNMPWQYAISDTPGSIRHFRFLGQSMTFNEKVLVAVFNKTPFRGAGRGLIPGNQITYPAFFNDQSGRLFVSYRFAGKPARSFSERMLSAGIARYDSRHKQWQAIGGEIPLSESDIVVDKNNPLRPSIAFAAHSHWTSYLPRLVFDKDNGMHVFWFWRQGNPGRDVSQPSYAFSPDLGESFYRSTGQRYQLPITVDSAEKIPVIPASAHFWPRLYGAMSEQGVSVLLQESNGRHDLLKLDLPLQKWRLDDAPPYGASTRFTACNGQEWAIATGPVLVRKRQHGMPWQLMYRFQNKPGYRYPAVVKGRNSCEYFISMQAVDESSMAIFHVLIDEAG